MRTTISGRIVARTVLGAAGVLTAVAVVGCSGGTATFTGSATPNGSGATTAVVAPPTQTFTAPAATSDATSATTSRGTPPTVTSSKTPECKPGNLRLSFGDGDAGMSQQHRALRFTNVSSTSCVVVGFPGVSYVAGDKGAQVGAPAVRSGKIGAQTTLKPGQVASTVISSVDVEVFDASVCKPTAVRGYRIYPPDSTASMFIALPSGTKGCAGSPPDPQLSVVSITRGNGDVD
jgi:Protein of unknown function (DUF4232)